MECMTPQPRLRCIVTLLKFNYKTSNNTPKNVILTLTLIPLDKIKRRKKQICQMAYEPHLTGQTHSLSTNCGFLSRLVGLIWLLYHWSWGNISWGHSQIVCSSSEYPTALKSLSTGAPVDSCTVLNLMGIGRSQEIVAKWVQWFPVRRSHFCIHSSYSYFFIFAFWKYWKISPLR